MKQRFEGMQLCFPSKKGSEYTRVEVETQVEFITCGPGEPSCPLSPWIPRAPCRPGRPAGPGGPYAP